MGASRNTLRRRNTRKSKNVAGVAQECLGSLRSKIDGVQIKDQLAGALESISSVVGKLEANTSQVQEQVDQLKKTMDNQESETATLRRQRDAAQLRTVIERGKLMSLPRDLWFQLRL